MKRKIKPQTITHAQNFLNEVSGKHLANWEVEELLQKHNCRKGLHRFARECNYAVKSDGKWLFQSIDFQPIHARRIIEQANNYQTKLRHEHKNKSVNTTNSTLFDSKTEWDMDALIDPVKNEVSNEFALRDIENEKKFKELYSEIDMLRKMIKSYQELLVLSTTSQELQEKRLNAKK